MAVVNNLNYDPNNPNSNQGQQYGSNNQQLPTNSQPISISGSSAPTISSSSSNASFQAPGAPTSSGNFTNLQAYLNANQGYNQGTGGLAGQVTSDVNKQSQGYQNSLNQGVNDFTNQVNASDIKYDPNLVNSVLNNPTNASSDQNSAFSNLLNATYAGPTDMSSVLPGLYGQASTIEGNAKNAQSEGGRPTLLNSLYGGQGTYNLGQQNLDNLILQGNPNQLSQLQTLQSIYDPTTGLTAQTNTADTNTQALAKAAQGDVSNAASQTQGALGGKINDFGTMAQNLVSQDQANRDASYQAAQQRLGNGQFTAQDLQTLGLTPGQSLYGQSGLTNTGLTENHFTPTAQNVITPDQQAQINALSSLAGTTLTGAPSSVLDQFRNNTQAGQFANQPIYNFLNPTGLSTALGNQQQAYNTAYTSEQGNISRNAPRFVSQQTINNATKGGPLGPSPIPGTQMDLATGMLTVPGQAGAETSDPQAYATALALYQRQNQSLLDAINNQYGLNKTVQQV